MPPPVPKRIISLGRANGKSEEGGFIEKEKKKMGRPTDSPKIVVKRARISVEEAEKLKSCAQKLKKSESDILRLGVEEVYQKYVKVN